jgi:hypothetical protein
VAFGLAENIISQDFVKFDPKISFSSKKIQAMDTA